VLLMGHQQRPQQLPYVEPALLCQSSCCIVCLHQECKQTPVHDLGLLIVYRYDFCSSNCMHSFYDAVESSEAMLGARSHSHCCHPPKDALVPARDTLVI